MPDVRKLALAGGPVAAGVVFVLLRGMGLEYAAAMTAAITVWTAAWWIFEPVPIPAASLIPFALFPLAGVLTHKHVAAAYGDSIILLMLGGFILSAAMEHSGTHRRLALGMVRAVGGQGGRRLVLGFMIATAGLSMWISNTATVLMLLPVALAVIAQSKDERLAVPLLLGVAYAASIGGVGTPVGTPPNIIFMGVYNNTVSADQQMSFAGWMKLGVPVVVVFLPLAWWWLTRGMKTSERLDLPDHGPWTAAEKRVMGLCGATGLLWISRTEPWGGWSGLLGVADYVHDSTVALLMAAMMFIVSDGKGGRLLDWPTAVRIPWGVLLLFGGGLCIAQAFAESGLSDTVGRELSVLANWPTLPVIAVISLTIPFLTGFTSNTATATLLMPILAAAALGTGIEPALLMAPAAISASCSFMFPVATPPNAIVFGSDRISVRTMAREGLALNLIGAAIITAVCYFVLR